jgi:hypothetical protein
MAKKAHSTGSPTCPADVAASLFAEVCGGLSFEEFINHDDLLERLAVRLRKVRLHYRLDDVLHTLATLRRGKEGLQQSQKRAHHDRLPGDLREAIEQATVLFRNDHDSRTVELLLIDPGTRQEFDDRLQAVGVLPEMLPTARRIAQNLTKDTKRHKAAIEATQAIAATKHPVRLSSPQKSAEESARQELAEHLQNFADLHPAVADDVRRILKELRARDGQQQFRQRLVTAYGGTCVVSECSVLAAIQAAHIRPFEGPATHHVTNGFLLRADLHALFDAHLLGIKPDTLEVHFHPEIVESGEYKELDGVAVQPPGLAGASPDQAELLKRWELFCERSRRAL